MSKRSFRGTRTGVECGKDLFEHLPRSPGCWQLLFFVETHLWIGSLWLEETNYFYGFVSHRSSGCYFQAIFQAKHARQIQSSPQNRNE